MKKSTKRTIKKKNNLSKVLAIDPGLRNTGWSISTVLPSGKLRLLASGVLTHNNDLDANIDFIKSLITDDTYVIIEEPPIIRVNMSSSHAMSKMFGAIYAAVKLACPKHMFCVYPKTWQSYILKEANRIRKKDGQKRLIGDEKELVLSSIANNIVTKRDVITNPHVLDCINLTIYYCKKVNGSNLNKIKFGDKNVVQEQSKKR